MKVEKYALRSENNFETFSFISQGPKGKVLKLIEFQAMDSTDTFNLAFGDQDPTTGSINDIVVTNNGDTEKVLATVVDAIYAFFDKHPYAYVYATGSTPARTRLYRMGITRFYQLMQNDFVLFGQMDNEFVPFKPGTDYEGFLAKRKFV